MRDWELARTQGDFEAALSALAKQAATCADASTRIELLTHAAEIQVDDLCDVGAGIATYETILGQDMFHAPTWNALEALYSVVQDWAKLTWLLEQRCDLATDPAECAGLLIRAATLAEELLGDVPRARAAYERALILDPEARHARAGLARLTG